MNLNDLYSELDLDSPIEILTVYCELLNNGTLSNNNSFKYPDNYQEDLNCDYNLSSSVLKGTGVTDENGMIVIEKLEYGKYYILEKEAPEGYTLNEERMYFEIKENGEIVKCTMKDEKIIEVPNTNKNRNYDLEIGSLLLIAFGTGVIIYRKIKNKKTNKSLFIIGSLILLSGITLAGFNLYSNYNEHQKIDDGIKNYYEKEETKVLDNENDNSQIERDDSQNTRVEKEYDYIAILRIPKIDLENGLVVKNSKYNNIRYNIMIHKESDSPEKDGGNVILVAHSESSKISYFRYLYKLKLGDNVYLYYKGKTYSYKLINIYDIEKTEKASIKKNTRKSSITLITCRTGTNKQIFLIGELI